MNPCASRSFDGQVIILPFNSKNDKVDVYIFCHTGGYTVAAAASDSSSYGLPATSTADRSLTETIPLHDATTQPS